MIKENVQRLIKELGPGVQLEAAAKTRSAAEIKQAAAAGVKIIGENYVQEAERAIGEIKALGPDVSADVAGIRWHFIGHLQKNKVNKAVRLFDLIETVDSRELAGAIDQACARENKLMLVLIEINSGSEEQKFGVAPEAAEALIRELSVLKNIRVQGLMTMGPAFGDPEQARPYFAETRRIFERLGDLALAGVEMKHLSMGMTSTYRVAIEEGANLVRIGSKIFGVRNE